MFREVVREDSRDKPSLIFKCDITILYFDEWKILNNLINKKKHFFQIDWFFKNNKGSEKKRRKHGFKKFTIKCVCSFIVK
jgi:hypothetical protein